MQALSGQFATRRTLAKLSKTANLKPQINSTFKASFFTGTAFQANTNTIRSTLSAVKPHGNRLRRCLTQNFYHQSRWFEIDPFQVYFVRIIFKFDRHLCKKILFIQIKQQLLPQLVEPLQAKLIFNAFWLFPVHVRVKCFDDPKPKSLSIRIRAFAFDFQS